MDETQKHAKSKDLSKKTTDTINSYKMQILRQKTFSSCLDPEAGEYGSE